MEDLNQDSQPRYLLACRVDLATLEEVDSRIFDDAESPVNRQGPEREAVDRQSPKTVDSLSAQGESGEGLARVPSRQGETSVRRAEKVVPTQEEIPSGEITPHIKTQPKEIVTKNYLQKNDQEEKNINEKPERKQSGKARRRVNIGKQTEMVEKTCQQVANQLSAELESLKTNDPNYIKLNFVNKSVNIHIQANKSIKEKRLVSKTPQKANLTVNQEKFKKTFPSEEKMDSFSYSRKELSKVNQATLNRIWTSISKSKLQNLRNSKSPHYTKNHSLSTSKERHNISNNKTKNSPHPSQSRRPNTKYIHNLNSSTNLKIKKDQREMPGRDSLRDKIIRQELMKIKSVNTYAQSMQLLSKIESKQISRDPSTSKPRSKSRNNSNSRVSSKDQPFSMGQPQEGKNNSKKSSNLFFKNILKPSADQMKTKLTSNLSLKVAQRLKELENLQFKKSEEKESSEMKEHIEEKSRLFSKAESAESFLLVDPPN